MPLQGVLLIAIIPRAMPWAKSFCPFRAYWVIFLCSCWFSIRKINCIFCIYNSSFASSEVKGVKGVIAPYGRWGVKTTVFFAYFFKQQDIRLNSLTPLTPLTSWYAKVQSIRFHIRYCLDLPLSMCSYEKVFLWKKYQSIIFFAERKDK